VSTAVSDSEIAPGTILANKYRVDRLIGQGGMGVVVEARHTALDDRVALKFLLPEYATHPEASQRFLREARAAVKIKSPHVARVSDVGTLESGAPYMVMEFLDGTDAAHIIEGGHLLPVSEAIDYVVQAADAIAEAHSLGIVHRDIKPANMFVTRHTDGSPFVKLLDFGISKMVNEGGLDALTRTTATMGSALYMSPEQIKQSRSVDHRTDIYALGVSLYELLSGRQPFIAENFAALCVEIATGAPTPLLELRPDVPPELAKVIEKAYARDLSERFQNIAEFVVALAPWALPRSQPIIERIARSAGLVPRYSSVPPPGDPGRGSYAHMSLGGTGGGLVQTGPSSPGGSSPGLNARAATNMSGSTTVPPVTPSPIKPILIALGVLAVLGSIAGAAAFALKGSVAPAAAESAAPLDSAVPAAAPVETTEVEPKVEPTTEPITEPAPSASAGPEPAPVTAKAAPKAVAAKPKTTKPEPAKPEPPPETKPAEPKPAPAPTKPKQNAESYR